jgi:thiol-disulfide isomerase/thioredoxin
MKTIILIAILNLALSAESHAWDSNSVFMGGSLNAAKERASRENKVLVLQFSAKWCLPCRYMEKNVILNPAVQKSYEPHAIIFQIDIDENKNLKEEFNIEVLPTIILMKASGEILSRREETFSAESFLSWIEKNKYSTYEADKIVTKEQVNESPVQVELPNLDTKEFEPELMQKFADANNNGANFASATKGGYHLQAGVFSNKANADNMVALLKMNFQEEIKISESINENTTIFKVRIGNFSNKDEAQIFQQVLEKYKFKAVIRQN